jgi:hypothetical protein
MGTGCEAHHSPVSIAKVKNAWNLTSTPEYVITVWCLLKQETRLHSMVLSYVQGQRYLYIYHNPPMLYEYMECYYTYVIIAVVVVHGLGPLTCSESASETVNPFRHFGMTLWMVDGPIAGPLPTQDSITR